VIVLGIADGWDAGAALAIDDQLVAADLEEHHDAQRRSNTFPWRAIEAVLRLGGVTAADVDVVSVAGRFSPPLFLRRRPGLRRFGRDPFSPLVDAHVFLQAMLRQTGWGAVDADQARDWFGERLGAHGFRPNRLAMVDIHAALADAAYRMQPEDEALIIVLHPMGDGVAVSVHKGEAGQLDRVWQQKGFESLHVHLRRTTAAIGLRPYLDDHRLWELAARGQADPDLVGRLGAQLRAEQGRVSRRNYPMPARPDDDLYRALSEAPVEVAAASIDTHLRAVVRDVVAWHVREHRARTVVVAGEVFENPRLISDLAGIDGIRSVSACPRPGHAVLAIGAAAGAIGLAPDRRPWNLGPAPDPLEVEAAIAQLGVPFHDQTDLVSILAKGGAVARFRGRAALGRAGLGSRAVLVRADERTATDRVRRALALPDDVVPLAVVCPDVQDAGVQSLGPLGDAAWVAACAPRVDRAFATRFGGVVTADSRAHVLRADADPGLYKVARAFYDSTRIPVLAAFPLARGDAPLVGTPAAALDVWRTGALDAIQLGDRWLVRGSQ
jgi:predicted NodU family carbamoyl transferase